MITFHQISIPILGGSGSSIPSPSGSVGVCECDLDMPDPDLRWRDVLSDIEKIKTNLTMYIREL